MKNPSFITIIFLLLIQAFLFFKKETLIKPEVSIYGYILMSDGLGRQSAELLDLYLKHSIDVSFMKTRGSHLADTPKSITPLIKKK